VEEEEEASKKGSKNLAERKFLVGFTDASSSFVSQASQSSRFDRSMS